MTHRDDFLKNVESYAAQGLSSGRIAQELGVTRNVVIGICSRNGIQLSGSNNRKKTMTQAAVAAVTLQKLWTAEEEAKLLDLDDKGMSRQQISIQLGRSFNSVEWKLSVLSGRRTARGKATAKERVRTAAVNTSAVRRPRPIAKASPVKEDTPQFIAAPACTGASERSRDVEMALFAPQRITLMELTGTTCRFPLGNPGDDDFCFCGALHAPEAGPYCVGHSRIAYQPVANRPDQPANHGAVKQSARFGFFEGDEA